MAILPVKKGNYTLGKNVKNCINNFAFLNILEKNVIFVLLNT